MFVARFLCYHRININKEISNYLETYSDNISISKTLPKQKSARYAAISQLILKKIMFKCL